MPEEFQVLFKKFVNGLNWLERKKSEGIDVNSDWEEFKETVVKPLEKKWPTLSRRKKDDWLTVLLFARKFKADIVEPEKPKAKKSLKNLNPGLSFDTVSAESVLPGLAPKRKTH